MDKIEQKNILKKYFFKDIKSDMRLTFHTQ